MLDQQILDLLGLARRSGLVVTGFQKADTALRTGRAVLLIEAKDAGKEGRSKLARHTLPGVEIWAPLTADLLGRAIGRDHAVHVAVGPGGLAERLKVALRRQHGFALDGSIGGGLSGGGPSAASRKPSTEHE
jgi:ribosomal protein L7Ae-like RNA K-turn-binding protein